VAWPEWDEAADAEEAIALVVQVNGKVRARIEVPADVEEKTTKKIALSDDNVIRHIAGREMRRAFYVKGVSYTL